jgi:oxygen-dependent protoporphyrinogen oxidase
MPGPFQDLYDIVRSLVLEPVFKGIFSGIIFEATREARPANLEDESVASFLERRLGNPHVGNNIVSAVLHGIYAGDIYQLSAKSLLPNLWQAEREHNSITEGLILKLKKKTPLYSERDTDLLNEITPKINRTFLHRIKESSVYTFREGIGQLSEALENSLKANPNVEFKIGDEVTSVEYDAENDRIKVCLPHNLYPCNI